jgi:4a-hydroxytetrahydrobiopterin dehydratase
MLDRTLLSESRIREALPGLPDWEYRDNRLCREYHFRDFIAAWAFMTGCALEAQALNHHPNWSNVWSKVVIELSTHDAGGVTGLDLELARRFEGLARQCAPTEK